MDSTLAIIFSLTGVLVLVLALKVRRKKLIPATVRILGAARIDALRSRAVTHGPHDDLPSEDRVAVLFLRGSLFGPRVKKYLLLGKASTRLRAYAYFNATLESIVAVSLLVSAVFLIISIDREIVTSERILTLDRIADWVQRQCGPDCPRSTVVRLLCLTAFSGLLIHEYIPDLRYKWKPKEGRYVRRW